MISFYLDLSDKMTKVKASALRGQSKDELTKQLNEHKQVFYHAIYNFMSIP